MLLGAGYGTGLAAWCWVWKKRACALAGWVARVNLFFSTSFSEAGVCLLFGYVARAGWLAFWWVRRLVCDCGWLGSRWCMRVSCVGGRSLLGMPLGAGYGTGLAAWCWVWYWYGTGLAAWCWVWLVLGMVLVWYWVKYEESFIIF